jgi:hypothetical protein
MILASSGRGRQAKQKVSGEVLPSFLYLGELLPVNGAAPE